MIKKLLLAVLFLTLLSGQTGTVPDGLPPRPTCPDGIEPMQEACPIPLGTGTLPGTGTFGKSTDAFTIYLPLIIKDTSPIRYYAEHVE